MPRLNLLLARWIARHEPKGDWRIHMKSTIGTALSVTLIAGLGAASGLPLLLAPLAPTALLVFGQPQAPGAQPINIFAGYFIGAVFAALSMLVYPEPWWLVGLAVGLTMLTMLVFRVSHPPAAAVPLMVYTGPVPPLNLFGALLASCIILVLVGMVMHRLPPHRKRYPLPLSQNVE
jgi:CBS-domain-containing membrane protein